MFAGVARGTDVYLFLVGVRLFAELARQEGLFDWLAVKNVRLANGSVSRLFTLIFAVGTMVTVFLSIDATVAVSCCALLGAGNCGGALTRLWRRRN